MSGRTTEQLRQANDPMWRKVTGAIRRMVVDVTTKAAWRVLGYQLPDGSREQAAAEVFPGVGFYSRPPTDVEAEVIVLNVGGAEHRVIIATRDEATRKAVAGALKANETALFNSAAIVYLKDDGTIEARSAAGTAVPLATLADLQALRDAFTAWVVAPTDGGAALKTLLTDLIAGPPAWPAGTTKFKAE